MTRMFAAKDAVLVRLNKPLTETQGGILIPVNAQNNVPSGMVLSVGSDVKDVKEGDEVFFISMAAYELEYGGVKFHKITEKDVLMIVRQ